MIKKLLLPVLLLCAFASSAQLNNSWIDYSKTYYKFKVAADNLCRIPQPALSSAGLGATNADHYQLWRNGQQVRLFTSVSGAALGSADYLEFWGQMNDGKADAELYLQPQFQLADKYSLETDTSVYFLTVNPTGGNLRYAAATNGSPGAASPDAYFMRSIDVYYRAQMNGGFAKDLGEYVYSSAYDNGEGFTSGEVASPKSFGGGATPGIFTETISNLNVYSAGPPNSLSLRAKVFFNTDNANRTFSVKVFNNEVFNESYFNTTNATVNLSSLPLNYLQNASSVPLVLTNTNTTFASAPPLPGPPTDRMTIATVGVTYPATFNFNNQKSFSFELSPTPSGNYLLIDNFNYGAAAPVLLDMTAGLRYVGDIVSVPGKVRFVLPPSSAPVRKFMLSNTEAANVTLATALTAKTFINYNTAATRGDYIIISHPTLNNSSSGVNNVELYRQYRASANGGGYNAKVYDINELTDQFAFGIKKHPAAVRDFVRFMDIQYPSKPKYILILGRGLTYIDARGNETNPMSETLNLVPTFGWPSSDVLLVSQPGTALPITPVGRVAAINATELGNYLQKVIQYEDAQRSPSCAIIDKAWMKNGINIVGGANEIEANTFDLYMDQYRAILTDTFTGYHVETFRKTSLATVQQASSERITQLFQEGLGFIGYFGHSSSTVFEFNLTDPTLFSNAGKYPFFNVSGCAAGNFYTFDPQRAVGSMTTSEKYTLTAQRGSIGFLASTHFGIPFALNNYNNRLIKNFASLMYGQSVGNQIKEVSSYLGGGSPSLDYYTRIHVEEINLHGDPAIKINSAPKPDYAIEDQSVTITPAIISVADPSFNVKIDFHNMGKAINDSIRISVKRVILTSATPVTLMDTLIKAPYNRDSLRLTVPIDPGTDKGQNRIIVTLDHTNRVDEVCETNNTVTKEFSIFEDELRPVFPYNYSIVNSQNITFSASTANPLVGMKNYTMEIDTTELFNSSFKKIVNISGTGGLIQFIPTGLTYTDSTVYYWRTAVVPANNVYIWNNSSFVYLPTSSPGFNQSHYYQKLKSNYDANIFLSPTRDLKFNNIPATLNLSCGNYPPNDYPTTFVSIGSSIISEWGNQFNTLQFTVLNGITGNAVRNAPGGLYGSNPPGTRLNQYEFYFNNSVARNKVRDFIQNNVASNATVIMHTLLFNPSVNSWVADWQADNGGVNNLYTTLKGYGFTQIDSFYRNIPLLFKFTKDGSTTSFQKVGLSTPELITADVPMLISAPKGEITSPLFGPAAAWSNFKWAGTSLEYPGSDSIQFKVIGVNNTGAETDLFTVDSTSKNVNISSINTAIYPFVKLKMINRDTINGTPYQLRYWRLNYTPVPEGAIAPNIHFTMKDTVEAGEPIEFSVAFKNVGQVPFASSMNINLRIKTATNADSIINIPPARILLASPDTLMLSYRIRSENYPGNNTLFAEFNPNNNQPEQFHFNNFLYKGFFVKTDKFNPLLDVTFDGVHILSRDIVSSKPNIVIKLKDESRFLALKDTGLLRVQLRYPDQTLRDFHFNGDTMRFNPADLTTGDNAATIDLKPYLPEDGEYELLVSGRDASGNTAGSLNYHTVFSVINKPMISEMLNYPNPFTTSTAFVFTLTGSQVPQNLRIQVLTITGKIVREIRKEELGPIHIGRNITEFKWDGTDMFGQKLANGVYIYRVITNLDNKSLDKYKAEGDNTDKFFNKGYGKMYLMR